MTQIVRVRFAIQDPPFAEFLRCIPRSSEEAEIVSIPFFIYDVAVGDVIRVVPSESEPNANSFDFDGLVLASRHSTFRLAIDPRSSDEDRHMFGLFVMELAQEWDLSFEQYSFNMYSFDADDGAKVGSIADGLPDQIWLDIGVVRSLG